MLQAQHLIPTLPLTSLATVMTSKENKCSLCRFKDYCSKKNADIIDGVPNGCLNYEKDSSAVNISYRSDESPGSRLPGQWMT